MAINTQFNYITFTKELSLKNGKKNALGHYH